MSDNKVASVYVELGANTAAFQGDMGKAARVAKLECDNIVAAAKNMGMLVGGAIAAGAAAFAGLARQSINAADEMNDLAIKVGMSTESLSAYGYAAKLNGADTQAFATSVQKLNSNVVDAARGQGAAKDAFAALGISVRDTNGQIKTNEQVMREVSDRFSTFPDGVTKSALAVDIFGKSGADMIQMLNGGSAGLDAMRAEAEQMGMVLSSDTAAAAAEVNDNIDKMGMVMTGLVNKTTADMLPVIKQLSGDLLDSAQKSGFLETAMKGVSGAFKVVVSGGYLLAGVFDAVGQTLGQLAAVAAAIIGGDFAAAKAIWNDNSADVAFMEKAQKAIGIWDEAGAAANNAATAQEKALGATPKYAQKSGRAASAKPKADPFDKEIEQWAKDAERQQAAWEREKQASASAVETIQRSLMTKRQLLDADYQIQQQKLQQAAQFEVITEQQKKDMLIGLEAQHKEKLKALDAEELERKRKNWDVFAGFANKGLTTIANSQSKFAKQAQVVQKAQALYQIGVDTRAAAIGAYKALVGIPYVGPVLAVAAAGAAIAFGAAQASAVGGGIGSSAVPSTQAVTPTAATSVEPAVSQQQAMNKQATIIQVPANRMMTGRNLVEWLDEAFGDGARLENARFVLA